MPSLQDLETVPEYSQLKPRILLHRDLACTGACSWCGFGHIGLPIKNVHSSRSLHDTEPPSFFIAAAAASVAQPAASCMRPRAAVVTLSSAVQGPGDRFAPAIVTHTGSRLQRHANRLLINIFPKYQCHTTIDRRMTANVRAR